jgi:hypothetical protein
MHESMKRLSTFLQILILLVGIAVLALMLWEPHLEGRNANATVFQIYFNDPFLAYAYAASIPFFVALFKAFKVLGYVKRDKALSQEVLKALRSIKYCGVTLVGLVAVGEIFIVLGESDDHAGGVFIGALIGLGSIAIAGAAAMFERMLKKAMD